MYLTCEAYCYICTEVKRMWLSCHRRSFGQGGQGGENAPSIFFLSQNIFLATETKEEQIKKKREVS
jgi:hypothetical protein